jgi:hypothetical protein
MIFVFLMVKEIYIPLPFSRQLKKINDDLRADGFPAVIEERE